VWPLERRQADAILRVGRLSLERWDRVDGRLSMVSRHVLDQAATMHPSLLAEGLHVLYRNSPAGPVEIVLESAWMPIVLCDTGRNVMRLAQVEALARYRFGQTLVSPLDPVAQWEIRADYVAGHRHALAFALSPQVRQVIASAASSLRVNLAALAPAFSWGWSRARAGGALPGSVWWLCAEQDRTLVSRTEGGRVIALHPGADAVVDRQAALSLVDVEAARFGLPSGDAAAVAVGAWHDTLDDPSAKGRVRWHDYRGPSVAARPTVQTATALP
jgi:hypothetical protein